MTTPIVSPLSVSLFGPVVLRHHAGPVPLNLNGATRTLLTLLLAHPGSAQRREQLVALLWPDAAQAKGRSALTTALWRINKLLAKVPGLTVQSFDDLVLLQTAQGVVIDGPELERLSTEARRGLRDEGAVPRAVRRALGDLLRRMQGDYLEGCDGGWALTLRAAMEQRRMRAIDLLMRDAEAQGAFEDAVDWGQAMLALDPLRESAYHDLMRLFVAMGERNQAILTYETLRRVLHEELQVAPDPETRALRDEILGQRTHRSGRVALMPMSSQAPIPAHVMKP
ncbi:AfsR/SARP family transcriptional regulator [Pacificoceanicola onchidii]|uniref:AfsR/SARP family transcriptional regulator n=1 Tax=Pacificoceanicola onchidii TaxID=2562685 RepID=UPI001455E285|nr:bacterial transcriptional activator domain-containing protein [Pacificoceanicola onchidii]